MKTLKIFIGIIFSFLFIACEGGYGIPTGDDPRAFNGMGYINARLASSGEVYLWNTQLGKSEQFYTYNICVPGHGNRDVHFSNTSVATSANAMLGKYGTEVVKIPVGYEQKLYQPIYDWDQGGNPVLGPITEVFVAKGGPQNLGQGERSPCY